MKIHRYELIYCTVEIKVRVLIDLSRAKPISLNVYVGSDTD